MRLSSVGLLFPFNSNFNISEVYHLFYCFRNMTTKLQGQPSVIFRQNFGFKPGLRNTLYSAVQGIQCDQYNSLPCQPVQTMDTSDNDNLANNFDSLKCEGENGYRGNYFHHQYSPYNTQTP